MFCHGGDRYVINIPHVYPDTRVPTVLDKTASTMGLYAFQLMVRENLHNIILPYGLFLTNIQSACMFRLKQNVLFLIQQIEGRKL